jgi:hypothetical protein
LNGNIISDFRRRLKSEGKFLICSLNVYVAVETNYTATSPNEREK